MWTGFTPTHYIRVAQVANVLGGDSAVEDALMALDVADWDVGGAMQQIRYNNDLMDQVQIFGEPRTGPDANRLLDRTRASGGPNWDKSKLQLRIHCQGRWKMRDYRAIDPNFDEKNPTPANILLLVSSTPC